MLQATQLHVNRRAGLEAAAEGTGALLGVVEMAGPHLCTGWAQSADAPDVPVTLLVMAGGEILARVPANRYRADLRAAGHGNGCYGFAVVLPEGAGAITVRRALDGAVLPLAAMREHIAAA